MGMTHWRQMLKVERPVWIHFQLIKSKFPSKSCNSETHNNFPRFFRFRINLWRMTGYWTVFTINVIINLPHYNLRCRCIIECISALFLCVGWPPTSLRLGIPVVRAAPASHIWGQGLNVTPALNGRTGAVRAETGAATDNYSARHPHSLGLRWPAASRRRVIYQRTEASWEDTDKAGTPPAN